MLMLVLLLLQRNITRTIRRLVVFFMFFLPPEQPEPSFPEPATVRISSSSTGLVHVCSTGVSDRMVVCDSAVDRVRVFPAAEGQVSVVELVECVDVHEAVDV